MEKAVVAKGVILGLELTELHQLQVRPILRTPSGSSYHVGVVVYIISPIENHYVVLILTISRKLLMNVLH